jgi:chemotaxis protein methyltransferase CheR
MDAIFCRNVLIYFDEATIAEVARRLHDALAPDGWLILGPSDPPLDRFAPLELAIRKNAIFYRRRTEPAPRPASAPPPIEETNGASIEVAGEIDSVLESAPFAPLDLDRASDVEPPDSPPPPARETSADERVERNPAIAIRELANLEGSAAAERATAEALARRPFSTELHYLRGALLMSMGRDREAEEAIRRTIYLDRTLEAPHFILGSILSRRGDAAGARRAYRNALKLCRARRAEEIVALADGESAGQLAEAAEAQLDLIERSQAK